MPTPPSPTRQLPASRLKISISAKRIERAVQRLAGQIDRYARTRGFSELCVVCVLDGAFVFCADLVRCLQTPTTITFVKARSYNGVRKGNTTLARLPGTFGNRPVLVVDTIYDTGKTIEKVLRAVRKQSSQVALALLVEKQGKAAAPADTTAVRTFVGIRIHGDPFLVGYGLDCDGRFRHLQDIRIYSRSAPESGLS
jgi:hypoxanthine phosphoribosyltransferase